MAEYNITQEALDSAKSAHKRIDRLEKEVKDIHILTASIARVDEKVDNVCKAVDEIKTDVKRFGEIPSQRYEKFVTALIGTLATGLVCAVLAIILK